MEEPRTCELCGTVNVVAASKCMACGQEFAASTPDLAADPLKYADADLDRSHHKTVYDQPLEDEPVEDEPQSVGKARVQETRSHHGSRPEEPDPSEPDSVRYVVRLLLPEGDRRSVEVGSKSVTLGSGLDELGLTGDPRVQPGEAQMYVRDGRLYVEPAPGAHNVYLRMHDEVHLADGDVVLMGDIAAAFTPLKPMAIPDEAAQALGGSTNAACGRMHFLRRDGSLGPTHDLPAGKTVVGRTDGHLNYPHDSRLSRRHVRFFASEDGVTVEDLDSRNGTYLRLRERKALSVGDSLRVGSAGVQIRDRISRDD